MNYFFVKKYLLSVAIFLNAGNIDTLGVPKVRRHQKYKLVTKFLQYRKMWKFRRLIFSKQLFFLAVLDNLCPMLRDQKSSFRDFFSKFWRFISTPWFSLSQNLKLFWNFRQTQKSEFWILTDESYCASKENTQLLFPVKISKIIQKLVEISKKIRKTRFCQQFPKFHNKMQKLLCKNCV